MVSRLHRTASPHTGVGRRRIGIRGLLAVSIIAGATVATLPIAGAGVASAQSCTSFVSGTYLGTWEDNSGPSAGSSGAVEVTVIFDGSSLSGSVLFDTGQTVVHSGDTLNGTVGCNSFNGTLDDVTFSETSTTGTTLSGTDSDTTHDVGTWVVGLVYEEVSSPSTTSLTTGSTTSSDDPIQTAVTSPTAGATSISTAAATGTSLPGYAMLDTWTQISTTADASTSAPLTLTFTLDSSVVNGALPSAITVFQNGVAVPLCTSTSPTISPDPCESSATLSDVTPPGIGDVVITVLTSSASIWGFGVSAAHGLDITTMSLPPVMARTKYSATLAAIGGTPPYKWSVVAGTLPRGLHLNAKGIITGKPNKKDSGISTVTVKVVDKKIRMKNEKPTQNTASMVLSITIS